MSENLGVINVQLTLANGEMAEYKREVAENLSQAIEKYGEEVVYSHFCASVERQLKARLKNVATQESKTAADVLASAEEWVPKVFGTRSTDKATSFMKSFEKLSPEEQEAVKATLVGA